MYQAAIAAGDIVPEHGRTRLREMREHLAEGDRKAEDRDPRDVYAAAEKEIQAAIRAGKITREQGKERLAGLRRHLAAQGRGTRDHAGREHDAGGEHR